MLVRFASTTTYGLTMNSAPAAACSTPRSGPWSASSSRTTPHAATARTAASHSRCTSQTGSPARSPSANHGAIGNA